MVKFARRADELGYDHLRLLDHVTGFVAEKHPEVEPTPYTHKSQFLEVFTLMAYLSAITKSLGFKTGVLALPQRQTALVAKQAAQVDIMCGGRLILGVGIGYNSVEFEAMRANFKDRASRIEEQIVVLRSLWTDPEFSFSGTWHTMNDVNINPLPIQRPIPIWMGAGRTANPVPPPKVLERIGKFADGFMPLFRTNPDTGKLDQDALDALEVVRSTAREHERDPARLGLEIGIYPAGRSEGEIVEEIDYLRSIGTTDIHARFPDGPLEEQLSYIEEFARTRDKCRKHFELT